MFTGRNEFDARASALCRHEAGHHVVARMCGFRVGGIRLQVNLFNNGRSGDSEVILASAMESLAEVGTYLEKRVKILYAGAAAEALLGGSVDQASAIGILQNAGGENDWARARDCIQLLRNILFPQTSEDEQVQKQLSAMDQRLWSETVQMVEKCADVIERLAEMMKHNVTPNQSITISGEEIVAVDGITELGKG